MNSDIYTVILPDDVSIPRREPDTHKGDYGRVLIIGGSVGYTGAPVLAAKAATRTGAGLTYVGVPESIYEITAMKLDEEMPFPLPDIDGCIASSAASEILRRAKTCDACLIGPGLGISDDITELVHLIMRTAETPLILDADALNAIAKNIDILNQAVCPLILTPHPGEFVRLGGNLPEQSINIHSERLCAAVDFSAKYGCTLVLKGHRTIIALPDGTAYVNTTGGPALAKGGTGDVLAGMITALIAQRIPIDDAAKAAVYLHGLSGDMCTEIRGEYSVTATDVINMLPNAMKTVVREL